MPSSPRSANFSEVSPFQIDLIEMLFSSAASSV
jgi:hypothetical protein